MSDEPHEPHDRETDGAARRPRRRRWGMRLLLTFLLFLLFAVAMQWGSTRRAERALRAEMDAVRAAGEPATVEEWNHWPGARSGTGENEMPLLRAAADPIDTGSETWHAAMDGMHPPPLSESQLTAIENLLKAYPNALAVVDAAASKGMIDWGLKLESPVMGKITLPDDKNEVAVLRKLEELLNAAARAAHQRGQDEEAGKRLGQMFFTSRARGHGPSYVNPLYAPSTEQFASRAVCELAPDLRVGAGVGDASPDQVHKLVARLLDESALAESHRRAWVGERVLQLDLPNSAFNSGSQTVNFGGVNMRIPGMRFAFRPMVLDNTRAMSRYA